MNQSDTTDYHKNYIESLEWELTVSCMLEDENSHCRKILKNNATYGTLLYNFLAKKININKIKAFVEAGGGYGWLARDFLNKNINLKAVMVDISELMLNNQKKILSSFKADFINEDFLLSDADLIYKADLIILNEVIGDFPVITDIELNGNFQGSEELNKLADESSSLIKKYSLDFPDEKFNFNYGAVKAVEKICGNSIPYAFISEHSCEAEFPDEYKNIFKLSKSRFPEEIKLLGHSEYTVKFSHLEKTAKAFGYETIRGQYIDFIEINYDGKVNFAIRTNSSKDELEIIRQFVYDLYKYEYLILIK